MPPAYRRDRGIPTFVFQFFLILCAAPHLDNYRSVGGRPPLPLPDSGEGINQRGYR